MTDTDAAAPEVEAQDEVTAAPGGEAATEPVLQQDTQQDTGSVAALDPQLLRLVEAVLFATETPMDAATLATRLPEGSDVAALLASVAESYAPRGVNLVQVGGRWMFRTAEDLAPQMRVYANPQRKLSRAAIETLAIVAYHQPITRAEMEEIRGVGLSKGTIDMLFEQGWITPRGRRQTPGKPVTWGSTQKFLTDFGIESLDSLPGIDELKAAGLLDKRPAIQITDAGLPAEEEPLSPEEAERLAEDQAFLAELEEQAASDMDEGRRAARTEFAAPGEAREEMENRGGTDEDGEDVDEDNEAAGAEEAGGPRQAG